MVKKKLSQTNNGNMKKYDIAPNMTPFLNNMLTEMITISVGKKKHLGDNFSVHCCVDEVLKRYGIHLNNATHIYNLPDDNAEPIKTNICVRYAMINNKFPLDNEFLFKQMYGYTYAAVDIGYMGFKGDCAYSFFYNMVTNECSFNKHFYESTIESRKFETFTEAFTEVIKYKQIESEIDKIFQK